VTYSNVTEIESAIAALAAAYPATAERIPLPHATHGGRAVHALRIGTRPAGAADGLLFLGGVHAREWVPPEALVSFAADVLEAHSLGSGLGYGGTSFGAAEVRRVIETTNVFVVPCVNPDGRHHSQTVDGAWRKNRRPAPAGHSGAACTGVDLNRNFDFLWDHLAKFAPNSGVATSNDPCHATQYRGPAPASEPETRNVVWLLDTYPRVRWLVDVHSAIPVILHSWGSDENQSMNPGENFRNAGLDGVRGRDGDGIGEYISTADLAVAAALADRMNDAVHGVRGNDYGVEQAYGLYPTSGASDDYAFSRHFLDSTRTKVYGFTIECGTSFQPTWSEAEDVIREVSAAALSISLAAYELTDGLRVTLRTPSITFNDVPEGETAARAVTWDVSGALDATFEIVAGPLSTSGPATAFSALLGSTVVVPAPGATSTTVGRLWLTYTGTAAGDTAAGTVSVRCQQTADVWQVPITANTIAAPRSAVVLVLDQSGSMAADAGDGRLRVEVLREAAHAFVDVLGSEHGIGVVRFDHDAHLGLPVTVTGPEVFGTGRAQAAAAVAAHSVNAVGATSSGGGAELAGVQLDAVAAAYDSLAMIVLTDGQENAPKLIADVAASIDDQVFAIGLGEPGAINPAALSAITNGSGGYVAMTGHLSADERFVLAKYYLQILAGVTSSEVVLDPDGRLRPGETADVPFMLGRSESVAEVFLLCPRPEAVVLSLRAPNGAWIDAATPGVRFVVGRASTYLRVELPLVAAARPVWDGRWVAHLERREWCQPGPTGGGGRASSSGRRGRGGHPRRGGGGVPWSLVVHARSDVRLRAFVLPDAVLADSPLEIRAGLRERSMPVTGALVRAEVDAPGYRRTLSLRAGRAGEYGADLDTAAAGVHRIRVVAEGVSSLGDPFTREATLHRASRLVKPGGSAGGHGSALPRGPIGS
jgi:murein tripeptide amidase MpaA